MIEFQYPERRTKVSEDKERMRLEPDRQAEPKGEDEDVEGHEWAAELAGETVAREDDDVEGHQFLDKDTGQTVAREDDDDVEGHQMSGQVTPEITP